MTHALQVLHTLQWQHPGGRALVQLAQAATEDYHSYPHSLLGGVEEEVMSPSGSPVRWQENTELLSVCGPTGTPQRVSLLGLRGKECSGCVHSVDVEEDGLRSPLLAESQFVVCVISAAWFSTAFDCTNSPYLPTCKAKADDLGLRLRNQDYLHVLYASQVAL